MEVNLDVEQKESDEKFGSCKSWTYYSTLVLGGNRKAGQARLMFYAIKSFAAVGVLDMLCHRMTDYLAANSSLPCNGEKALDHLAKVLEVLVLICGMPINNMGTYKYCKVFSPFSCELAKVWLQILNLE
jgi:hypothetical protein